MAQVNVKFVKQSIAKFKVLELFTQVEMRLK